MVRTVGRATFQHEASVAITAIDIAVLVNFQIDPGMAQRGRAKTVPPTNLAGAIAADARVFDKGQFGRCNVHG